MIDLTKKKILITGAGGFIGKRLVEDLLEKKFVPKENLFLPAGDDLDLRKMEDCKKAVLGQDIVIHLAGTGGSIDYKKNHPGQVFYDNAIIALNMLEAARIEGVEKFVGMGSITEYPEKIRAPLKEENLWQGYPDEINAPFSMAKKFMLVQSQAYAREYGLNAIHLLMGNVYGPGDNFERVIPALIKKIYKAKMEGKKDVEVWGTGKPTRQFIYVDDAVEAIILATEKYDSPQPINISSGREISIKELAGSICKLINFKGEIKWDPSKPDGRNSGLSDFSKAKNEIGFEAKTGFGEGLKNTINWYIKNYESI